MHADTRKQEKPWFPLIPVLYAIGLLFLLVVLAVLANAAPSSNLLPPSSRQINFQRTDYATKTDPQSIAVGDFNHDGKQDMAIANYNNGAPGSISVFLGNGDGTFQPAVTYNTGSGPVVVATADLNHDGNLDLVTADDTSASVSVLLGNGDGTFKPHVDYAAGSFPHWVAIGDVNNDGIPDLVDTNEGDSTISIFLGNGDGTFQPQTTVATPQEPYSVVIADFNHDGLADLGVTGYFQGIVAIYLGSKSGFQNYTTYACGEGPAALITADFNHDGNPDLAVADYNNGNTGYASVLLGNSDGTFQPQVQYTAGTGPDGIAVGDFNGDRKLDLVISDLIGNTMSVLYGNGDGTFQAPANFNTGTFPIGAAAGQFSHTSPDSDDIVITNDLSASASVFLNEAATNVTLTSAPNPSTVGQFVAFTATITSAISGLPVPTGKVELISGPKTAVVTITNGVAMASIKIDNAGSFKVTAVYSGDSNFNPSRSNTIIQVVNP